MRCRNCNEIMSLSEMMAFQDDEKTIPEDMCRSCLTHVWNIHIPEHKEFLLENACEGLTEMKYFDGN